MAENDQTVANNKALVQASFDRWRSGTGSPFELLVPEADWTIVGSSPLSKTYPNGVRALDGVSSGTLSSVAAGGIGEREADGA